MTNMPFVADPSDPGIGIDDDPVVAVAHGHGEDSTTVLGSEVGEASDDDVAHTIISVDTVEAAAENLHEQERGSAD